MAVRQGLSHAKHGLCRKASLNRNAADRGMAVESGFSSLAKTCQAVLGVGQINGGEAGIRTLGTLLEYGALAKRCFRPLSHLTPPPRMMILPRGVNPKAFIKII